MILPEEAGLETSFLSFRDEVLSLYHMPIVLRNALKSARLQTSTLLSTITKNPKSIEVQIIELVFVMCLPRGWHKESTKVVIHTHIIARLVLMKNLQYNHSPGALQILLKGQGQSDYRTAQAAPGLGPERKKSKSQTK